jgi:hypothetical protein
VLSQVSLDAVRLVQQRPFVVRIEVLWPTAQDSPKFFGRQFPKLGAPVELLCERLSALGSNPEEADGRWLAVFCPRRRFVVKRRQQLLEGHLGQHAADGRSLPSFQFFLALMVKPRQELLDDQFKGIRVLGKAISEWPLDDDLPGGAVRDAGNGLNLLAS